MLAFVYLFIDLLSSQVKGEKRKEEKEMKKGEEVGGRGDCTSSIPGAGLYSKVSTKADQGFSNMSLALSTEALPPFAIPGGQQSFSPVMQIWGFGDGRAAPY